MSVYGFGSGLMYATRTDIANATPRRFGAMQDIELSFSGDLKELFGQQQFALDVARGKIKIEGKAKFAQISANVMNDMFFGATSTTGNTLAIFQEAHSVPGVSTYTFTATNVAGFKDLGCRYAATGIVLTLVASGPTTGQYSVSTVGVYTFAAGDASASMLIDYTYTTSSGLNLAISNQLMGSGPRFKTVCTQTYTTNGVSQTWVMTLNACMSSKLTLPTKLDDYVIQELDFQVFADAAGNIGNLAISDIG